MGKHHSPHPDNGVFVFSCSGGSDVGELADRVARRMAHGGKAKMFCLAGVGAQIEGILASTRAAAKIIALDGCPVLCAKKTLEHAGFSTVCVNLREPGFEKGKTPVDETAIQSAFSKITKENPS